MVIQGQIEKILVPFVKKKNDFFAILYGGLQWKKTKSWLGQVRVCWTCVRVRDDSTHPDVLFGRLRGVPSGISPFSSLQDAVQT